MFITHSWILLSVLAIGIAQELKPCNITNDIQGECILLGLCPRARELLAVKDIATLRNLTCGYDKLDIKVCCVTNRTDGALIYANNTQNDTDKVSMPNVILPPDPTRAPPATSTPKFIYTTKFTVTTAHGHGNIKTPGVMDYPSATLPERVMPLPATTHATRPPVLPPNTPVRDDRPPVVLQPGEQSQISPALPEETVVFEANSPTYPSWQHLTNLLPSREECGEADLADKIFGGQVAGLDEMPWLTRIKYLNKNGKELYACHGSLITDRFVLTAAHCVYNLKIIDVRLGEWDSETSIDCNQGYCNDPPVDVEIDEQYIYPYFNRTTFFGDIALLRLKKPVNFTDFVRPVCLPTTEYVARQDYEFQNSYTTGGWGKTEYETRAVVKKKVNLNAVPISTCRVALKRISDDLATTIICAGGRKGEDSCAGDSGSSLVKPVRESNRENWFLFGVTSFGPSKCGSEGLPGVYTRITTYMDWILNTIAS